MDALRAAKYDARKFEVFMDGGIHRGGDIFKASEPLPPEPTSTQLISLSISPCISLTHALVSMPFNHAHARSNNYVPCRAWLVVFISITLC